MAVELATGYVSLVSEASQLVRGGAQAFDRIATDAQRRLARAFDASADDMVRAFGRASNQAWGDAAQDMRAHFSRAIDTVGDDLHRELAQASAQTFSNAADDMQGWFRRGFDASADDMQRAFARASDRVGRDLEQAIGDAGQDAGQQGGNAAAGGIADSLKGNAGVIGQALGAVFAVAGVSAGGLLAKALQQGMEREKALDLTQARLGVDEETMQRIGAAAGRAYVGAFGESVEENVDVARQAFQSGLIDGDSTAAEIQKVIQQIQGVTELIGGDLTETTKAASTMLKAGLAENASEAFDAITAGYRAVGPAGDDLIDSIKEYSSGWKNTGLNASQAMALIGQSIELGADSTDRAADALREFGRRVYEEEEDIVEALDEIGLNGKEMYARFAEGGQTAFDAFDEAFDKIRLIKDPVERNTAAMALLGDTAGDFIGTFTQWDPSAAVEKFGQVQGAADAALATMGGNSASTIESAKRSIEVSADGISSALARAFGPELDKVANWVTTHQPEILGFLGDIADWALIGADGFLVFASSSLRAFGMFAEGARSSLSSIMDPLGLVAELFGKLTGSGDLEDLGNAMQDLDDQLQGAADGAFSLADAIDDKARPKLLDLRNSVADNVEQAVVAQEMFRALGDQVAAVPDGKTITVTDNSPEAQVRFAELGIRIEQIPGTKEFRLAANTADGQSRIDEFVRANSGRQVPISVVPEWTRTNLAPTTGGPAPALNPLDLYQRAAGGVVHAGDAKIAATAINQYAEAGPEAYIPLSPSKRDKSVPIWMEVGRRLGLITAMAAGGIVPGKAFAQSLDPAKYQMGGFSTSAIDCSGLVSAVVNDALGRPPFSSRMSTMSEGQWLAALGAKPGLGGPGDISVGWYDNGGGANGHTAMTLGDGTNVESNGSEGVVVGGKVGANHSMFTQRMHLPAALLRGGDLGGPATGAPAGAGASTGGSGGAGATGGLGGGTAAGAAGGTFGGVEVPAGVTPVWIVGSNVAGTPSSSNSSAGSSNSPSTTAAPSESFAPQASTQPAPMPDIGARALQAGSNFLNANLDQFLGDIGLRREGGAIQALAKVIFDAMARATSEAVAQATRNPGSLIRHAGRPF